MTDEKVGASLGFWVTLVGQQDSGLEVAVSRGKGAAGFF
jgi:hypothetical protein